MTSKNSISLSRFEVRDVDRRAIEKYHLPGIVLMENAGRGAAELLLQLGIHGRVVICAGKGNNGGDGFVIARHLEIAGIDVRVLLFTSPEELSCDAATNYQVLQAAGTAGLVLGTNPDMAQLRNELSQAAWIVDALLGTGTQGSLRTPYPDVIRAINESGKRILAVDLPSGMDCDSGKPLEDCVRANHTVTFVACKRGFDNEASRKWTGDVHVVGIGVPQRIVDEIIAERGGGG